MNINLLNIYKKNNLKYYKKNIIKIFNVYGFYLFLLWSYLLKLNTKIKDGNLKIEYFIGQVVKLCFKHLNSYVYIYMQFSHVNVLRRVFLFNCLFIKYYALQKFQYVLGKLKKKKKVRYFVKKYFKVLQ